MANKFNQMLQDKARYKQFLKQVDQLAPTYQTVLLALQKYIWNFANSGSIMDALEEILRIFQESQADQVPVAQIVGSDPVEFAETIMAQYPDDLWLVKYRNQLRQAVKEAEDARD